MKKHAALGFLLTWITGGCLALIPSSVASVELVSMSDGHRLNVLATDGTWALVFHAYWKEPNGSHSSFSVTLTLIEKPTILEEKSP
jgi:hypothetical protein